MAYDILLLGGVVWSCGDSVAWGGALLTGARNPIPWVSMPVGDTSWVTLLYLLVVDAKLHGLLRSLIVGLFDGWRASNTLSNQVTARLISTRRELTLTERGDLDSHLGLRSFGVAAVLVMALLFSFSLAIVVHIIMPMVGNNWGEELT